MSLHYLLKAGRRSSGYSLREAAALLGLSPSTLYRYEEGLIRKIPEDLEQEMLRFYQPHLKHLSEELDRNAHRLAWTQLALTHPPVTPESLYAYFMAADSRGQQALLELLRYESSLGQRAKKE